MKKLHVLIPSLVATVGMPLVSMVGCGNQDPVKPTETYVVTLFAGQGTFGETNQIILSNIQPGTLLKDVEGYKKPQGESFIGWLNNGTVFSDDKPVNSNMLLTAKYNDPEAIHTITLFAGQGVFADQGTNVKKVSVTGDQTTLEQAIDSIEPLGATKFHGWITNTGAPATMTDPVIADVELSAQYEPAVVKYKAYVVKTDDKDITITNDEVTAGQQFVTTVEYLDGDISPTNISVYVGGTLVVPSMGEVDSHHVSITLTSSMTTGDVAIVVKFETTTNNYSYLCNDPADGLTLTNSEIQPSATTIGTINSPVNIENNWVLDKVVMGGSDVTDNFELEFDETDDKKATIKVLNGYVISDDVLIWLKPTTPGLEWTYEDGPCPIEPLPATTGYEEALEKFYEFALNDKLNIVKDFVNTRLSGHEGRYLTITVSKLSFDPVDKVFTCSWNFAANDGLALMIYGRVENLRFKVVKSSEGKYETRGLPSLMSTDDEIYNFLTSDSSWSIAGIVVETSSVLNYACDANIIKAHWDTFKVRIAFLYDVYCLSHQIYYLQNITPGP